MSIFSKIFKRNNKQQTAPESVQPIEKIDELPAPKEPDRITLKEAFALKYPPYAKRILEMFEAANLCEATWENLTKVRLQKFVEYMGERISPNSVHQYATKMKALLNLYSDEVELPRGFAKILTPKKAAVQNVYLTEEEIQRLVEYAPKNDREKFVKYTFLCSCFAGMRHSDAIKLTESNIVGDTIQYVSVKTKIHATIPLKPVMREYIVGRPAMKMDDTTYNRIIRRICQKCGLCNIVKVFKAGEEREGEKWQYISSHTARRSFASNLYLRGVDVLTISRMLGHTSVETTQKYIRADRQESEELLGYFK